MNENNLAKKSYNARTERIKRAMQDMMLLVNCLIIDLNTFDHFMGLELDVAKTGGDSTRIDALIRSKIRLTVSFFEATCFCFRSVAQKICDFSNKKIPDYIIEQNKKQSAFDVKDKIKNSFEFFSYATDLDMGIKTNSPEWQRVCAVIKKRHNLTHPNNISKLRVTGKDKENADISVLWFINQIEVFKNPLKFKKIVDL
jgi:hypothetical protein